MRRRWFGHDKASVLVTVVLFIALLAIIMIPAMQFFTQNTRMAQSARASQQSFYAAEAGVARTLSYIFSQGGGAATGIYASKFAVTQAGAMNPFTVDWVSLAEGINAPATGEPAVRVRVWQDQPSSLGTWKIQAVGRMTRPKTLYRTVTATVRPGSFARYAFFNTTSLSTMDGQARWLGAGEVFNGPVHSNRHLFVTGDSGNHLVFNSDVTIVGSEVLTGSAGNVEYNGLKDTNAGYVELPSDLTILKNAAIAGGINLPAGDTSKPAGFTDDAISNYKFVFNSNGTVTITNLDAQAWAASHSTVYTPMTKTIANTNGAMVVNNGNVFVSGIVKGRVTVAALANHSSGSPIAYNSTTKTDGNLIIDGNLIYSTHPKVGGNYDISDNRQFPEGTVTDVMGLIAERNFALDHSMPTAGIVDAHIMLTGQATANPDVRTWPTTTNPNTTVNQAINQDGAFFVEDGVQMDLSKRWTGVNDNDSGWKFGDLYLTGGVVHFLRGQTRDGNGGFERHYAFDQRLLTNPPPYYPLTPDLDVVRWEETASTTLP